MNLISSDDTRCKRLARDRQYDFSRTRTDVDIPEAIEFRLSAVTVTSSTFGRIPVPGGCARFGSKRDANSDSCSGSGVILLVIS